jgi:hypothetical protein
LLAFPEQLEIFVVHILTEIIRYNDGVGG